MKPLHRIIVISSAILSVLIFGFLWHFNNQEKHYQLLEKERIELEKILSINQRELDILKAELENIESPEAKEKMIREKLGMMKKDEIQYIIQKIEEDGQGE